MKKYKKPSLVSYKSQDITEILGPVETNGYGPVVFEKRVTTGRNMKKRRFLHRD